MTAAETERGSIVSLLDRVKASAVHNKPRKKCATCRLLDDMSPADLADYHETVALIGQQVDGVRIVAADIARGMDLLPATYRQHITNGHREPR